MDPQWPQKLWAFLFPSDPAQKCKFCGKEYRRAVMFHDHNGYFCNEAEADEYWQLFQW
jgi:hypothetical protein